MTDVKRARVGVPDFATKCAVASLGGKYVFTDEADNEAVMLKGMEWHTVECICKYAIDATGRATCVSIRTIGGGPDLDKAAMKQLKYTADSYCDAPANWLRNASATVLKVRRTFFYACTPNVEQERAAWRQAKKDNFLAANIKFVFRDHPWQWLEFAPRHVHTVMQCVKVHITHHVCVQPAMDSDSEDDLFGEFHDFRSAFIHQIEVADDEVPGLDRAVLLNAIRMEAELHLEYYVFDLGIKDIQKYICKDGMRYGVIPSTWFVYIAADHAAREAMYPHDHKWAYRREVCEKCQETLFFNPEAKIQVQVSQFDFRTDPWFAETMAPKWKVDSCTLDVTIDTGGGKTFVATRVPEGLIWSESLNHYIQDIVRAAFQREDVLGIVEVCELIFGTTVRVHKFPGAVKEAVVVKDVVLYLYHTLSSGTCL